MAQAYGSTTGIFYPLGLISVTTAGTPVLLSANVPITTAFGSANSQAPMCANQLIFSCPGSNTGLIYLVFKGGSKASGNSVILTLTPGQTYTLQSPQLSNPFLLTNYALDADVNANTCYVTAVIV